MKTKDNRTNALLAWVALITLACTCGTCRLWPPSFLSEAEATAQAVKLTAEGLATEIGESDFMTTLQAFATQDISSWLATAQVLITQEGSQLIATAQAVATQGAIPISSLPSDIPVVEEGRTELFGSRSLISYSTTLDYHQVVVFYSTEMPANGWEPVPQGTFETDQATVLSFTKAERTAIVTISQVPSEGKTFVTISINE
ncbi:MAG: hypothetical protein AB1345_14265 [Chloroflexota bacterium]